MGGKRGSDRNSSQKDPDTGFTSVLCRSPQLTGEHTRPVAGTDPNDPWSRAVLFFGCHFYPVPKRDAVQTSRGFGAKRVASTRPSWSAARTPHRSLPDGASTRWTSGVCKGLSGTHVLYLCVYKHFETLPQIVLLIAPEVS